MPNQINPQFFTATTIFDENIFINLSQLISAEIVLDQKGNPSTHIFLTNHKAYRVKDNIATLHKLIPTGIMVDPNILINTDYLVSAETYQSDATKFDHISVHIFLINHKAYRIFGETIDTFVEKLSNK